MRDMDYALLIIYSLSYLHVSCDIVRAREPIVSSHLTGLNDTKHDFIITPLSETVTIEYFVFMCIDALDVVLFFLHHLGHYFYFVCPRSM